VRVVVERVYGFYRHNHQSLIAGVVERFNHANLWRVKILQIISQNPVALTRVQETDIFFDAAVISRDALMVRSRRSWCSSNSARNVSNMGRKGDCWAEGASIVSDLGRFWPICCVVVFGESFWLCHWRGKLGVHALVCSLFRIWFQTLTCFLSFHLSLWLFITFQYYGQEPRMCSG
jgi:hypothetical protein